MAEFSKQYCEIYAPELGWDFDIDEIATEIPHGYYKDIVCEGFGFAGIGRGMDDTLYVIMESSVESFERIDYKKFINKHKNNVASRGI